MRLAYHFGFAALCAVSAWNLSAQQKETEFCPAATTQSSLNECAADMYAKADDEMKLAYRTLLAKYKDDAALIMRLKAAQQSWLRFRDADVGCLYYQPEKLAAYGSVYPMCHSVALRNLTLARLEELKAMLVPVEGDVCGFTTAAPQDPPKRFMPQRAGTLKNKRK